MSIICREGSLGGVIERGVDRSWFVAYTSLWDSLLEHRERYGDVPSLEVLRTQTGMDLPDVEGKVEWAVDRLRDQSLTYGLRTIVAGVERAVDQGEVQPTRIASQVADRLSKLTATFDHHVDVDVIHDYHDRYQATMDLVRYREEHGEGKWVKTGFRSMDEGNVSWTTDPNNIHEGAPWVGGNLITVMGDTGSWKSFFLQGVSASIAKEKHVLIFSLEMDAREV